MQDRLPPDRRKPLATRGRTIHPGQYAKSSLRADVFRFAPNIGRYSAASFMGDFDYRAGSRSIPLREKRCERSIRLV
jgi:hypothetical protein